MKLNIWLICVPFLILASASCSTFWSSSEKKDEVVAPAKEVSTATVSGVSVSGNEQIEPAQLNKTGEVPLNTAAESSTASITQKQSDELSLKQARIMGRMDEIENELKHQREKIRLLEQGLLTGIAPDDLKKSQSKYENNKKGSLQEIPGVEDLSIKKNSPEDLSLSKPNLDDIDSSEAAAKKAAENGDSSSTPFNSRMQIAKEQYQSGRFGLAIADLAGMSREFGEKAGDGEIKVWLGKSYLGLKEFGTARAEFEAYLKGWPSGSYVALTRLDLAKVYVGLGLKERARGELRRVIKEFQGEEFSEMASLELKNLQGAL